MLKKRNVRIALIVVVTLTVATYLLRNQPDATEVFTLSWLAFIGVLLWIGNKTLSRQMDKWFPWLKYGKRRFFVHLILGIVYSIGIINLAYFLFRLMLIDTPATTAQIVVMNVWGALVFIPAFSVYFSLYFLDYWQKSELEMERFQKESMRSQLSTLKSHLDPHFLFNNLNILSSLIDKDQEQSQNFLIKFAQVYRTMLQTKVEDLVTLEEEMRFIESYIYLIKTRFEENIQFQLNIEKQACLLMLPPLTVQMIIENAIKHNNITENQPLVIEVSNRGNRLEIRNNLNEKPEDLLTKSGTGLNNIRDRFAYYTDEQVVISKTPKHFIVTLPLLEIESL